MELKCTICKAEIGDYLAGWLFGKYGYSEVDHRRVVYRCPNCRARLQIKLEWQPAMLKSTKIEVGVPF